jgi:hypothetical protein
MNINLTSGGDKDYAPMIDMTGKINQSSAANKALARISGILGSLAALFFSTMWGSLILSGTQLIKSGFSMHKASTLRREEIMKQLMSSKRNLKEDFEFVSIGALLNEFYY